MQRRPQEPRLKIFASFLSARRFAYVTRAGLAFSVRQSETSGEFGRPAWNQDGAMMVFHREIDRSGDHDRAFTAWHSPDPRFNLLRVNGHTSFSPEDDRMVFNVTNFAGDVATVC